MNFTEAFEQLVSQYNPNGGDLNGVVNYINTMAASGKTPFLGLNQWQSSDKPVMKDFNEDNRKIDEGFAALKTENNALRAELTKKADIVHPQIHELGLTEIVEPFLHHNCWKTQEGIVTVAFSVKASGSVPRRFVHDIIAVLPTGFRPKGSMNVPINFNGAADTHAGGHGYIHATGEITAWAGAFEAMNLHGNFSFPVF